MSLPRKSDPSEVQERNGQDHIRSYNPSEESLLQEILKELRHQTFHLKKISGREHE